MANEEKKDFNAMLHRANGMPKVQLVTDEATVKKYGGTRMYFAPPLAYDTLMRQVPPGRLTTVGELRALLARNPKMRIIIYTLELNILAQIPALFEKYRIGNMEALQISVSKLRANGMFETKPVPWIISGVAGE